MVSINTKSIHIDLELKKKIEFVSNFCNTTPKIIEGSVKNINSIIVKGTTLLAFNYSKELYVEGLDKKIEIKDLKEFIKELN